MTFFSPRVGTTREGCTFLRNCANGAMLGACAIEFDGIPVPNYVRAKKLPALAMKLSGESA
jgi:hypothetical protein